MPHEKRIRRERPKGPTVPAEKTETVRRLLQALLRDGRMSAKDISFEAHISEKDVYGHLEHLRKSLPHENLFLENTPASCRACGFVFHKRNRLTPPGKCPVCRSEQIAEPLFYIPSDK